MATKKKTTPRGLPVITGAPLQLKLQARLGIVEQLAATGGSMPRRQLFNVRRDRKNIWRWIVAMTQLLGNGIVVETGSGRRGDPVTVRLVKPLPEADIKATVPVPEMPGAV